MTITTLYNIYSLNKSSELSIVYNYKYKMANSWLSSFIRNRDYFGNPILLTFNKKGNTHNTFLGGLVSLLVNITFLGYAFVNFQKLIFYLEDRILTTFSTVAFEEFGEINFADTNYMFSFTLMDGTNWYPIKYDDEAKRHVTI